MAEVEEISEALYCSAMGTAASLMAAAGCKRLFAA